MEKALHRKAPQSFSEQHLIVRVQKVAESEAEKRSGFSGTF
jgi:hypothetical protein